MHPTVIKKIAQLEQEIATLERMRLEKLAQLFELKVMGPTDVILNSGFYWCGQDDGDHHG